MGPAPIDTQACQQQVDSSTSQESHVQVCHARCDPLCCSGAVSFSLTCLLQTPCADFCSVLNFLQCCPFLPTPPWTGSHQGSLATTMCVCSFTYCALRCRGHGHGCASASRVASNGRCTGAPMCADSGTSSSRGCTGLARRHTRVLTVDGVPDAALPPGVVPGALPAQAFHHH